MQISDIKVGQMYIPSKNGTFLADGHVVKTKVEEIVQGVGNEAFIYSVDEFSIK